MASYEMTKLSPRDAFLKLPAGRVWNIERIGADARYRPDGPGKPYWQITPNGRVSRRHLARRSQRVVAQPRPVRLRVNAPAVARPALAGGRFRAFCAGLGSTPIAARRAACRQSSNPSRSESWKPRPPRSRARAGIKAGRVVGHAKVVEWLKTWGTADERPIPPEWLE